ncbi:MAG: SDR family oxidoreductase [Pseudomonadota bacterium]
MQKIFITGASSGIGQALAHEYAKRHQYTGCIIGLAARRSEHLQELADSLQNQYKTTCRIYPLDVRDSLACQLAAQDFIQQYGAPNIVIANAGVSRGTLTEFREDMPAFQAVMDINVMGMVHTFQPFIKAMVNAAKHGTSKLNPANKSKIAQLVGIASVAGIRGLPGAGAYSASKAAAISYLESLRVEMAAQNIAVTTIAPGYIRTAMTDVNQYKMPFLMDADIAAAKFVDAIKAKRRFVVIPWQMGFVARFMRFIPPFLWDWAMKKAPYKERTNWDWL